MKQFDKPARFTSLGRGSERFLCGSQQCGLKIQQLPLAADQSFLRYHLQHPNRAPSCHIRRRYSSNLPSSPDPTHNHRHHQHYPPEGELYNFYGTFLFRGILACGMVYSILEYVAEITLLEGPSMYPTLHPYGEIVLIDKWTLNRIHRKRRQRRGRDNDVSISRGEERVLYAQQLQDAYEKQSDSHIDEWYEPRISVSDEKASWSSLLQLLTSPLSIGDVVVLQHPNRKGTICKRVLGLPGDTVLRPGRKGLLVIPDGHLWVEGDNPSNSSDSRTYGSIPMALLRGRVLCRIWPLRGEAILVRGAPPRQGNGAVGYTVLPAGYEGQRIVKSKKTLTEKPQRK